MFFIGNDTKEQICVSDCLQMFTIAEYLINNNDSYCGFTSVLANFVKNSICKTA